MKSAVIFVLIVTVCAKYNIVGKFLVTENTCNQEVYNQVTDFYFGATPNFSPVDDVEAYPYSINPNDILPIKSEAIMDGDRIYLLSREEYDGTNEPATGLVMVVPDCNKLTDKSFCVSKTECEWVGDDEGTCESFACRYDVDSDCNADTRCYFDTQCHIKYPICASYEDAYSCLHNEGTVDSDSSEPGNCQWVENTKKCILDGARKSVPRNIEEKEVWDCVWSEVNDVSGEEDGVTFLTCTRTGKECSFTMEYLGIDVITESSSENSAQSFIVSLAVVGLALVFVLL